MTLFTASPFTTITLPLHADIISIRKDAYRWIIEYKLQDCQHESDGYLYHVNGLYIVSIDETNAPFTSSEKYKCIKCGGFYR